MSQQVPMEPVDDTMANDGFSHDALPREPVDTEMTDVSPYESRIQEDNTQRAVRETLFDHTLPHDPHTSLVFSAEDLADPHRDYFPNWFGEGMKKIVPSEGYTSSPLSKPKPKMRLPLPIFSSKTPQKLEVPKRTGYEHFYPKLKPNYHITNPKLAYQLSNTSKFNSKAPDFASHFSNFARPAHDFDGRRSNLSRRLIIDRSAPNRLFGDSLKKRRAENPEEDAGIVPKYRRVTEESNGTSTEDPVRRRSFDATPQEAQSQLFIAPTPLFDGSLKKRRAENPEEDEGIVPKYRRVTEESNGTPAEGPVRRRSFDASPQLLGSSPANAIPGHWPPTPPKVANLPVVQPQSSAVPENSPAVIIPGHWPATPSQAATFPAVIPGQPESWNRCFEALQQSYQQAWAFHQGMAHAISNAYTALTTAFNTAGAITGATLTTAAQQVGVAAGTVTQRVLPLVQGTRNILRDVRDLFRERERARNRPGSPRRRYFPGFPPHSPRFYPPRRSDGRYEYRPPSRGNAVDGHLPFPDLHTPADLSSSTTSTPVVPPSHAGNTDRAPPDSPSPSPTPATRVFKIRSHPARSPSILKRQREQRAFRGGILKNRSAIDKLSPKARRAQLAKFAAFRVTFKEPLEEPSPVAKFQPPAPKPEPYVDPWARPPEFPLGRPLSAVSLFKAGAEIPEGRTESIYADEWRKMQAEQATAEAEESPKRAWPKGPAVLPLTDEWDNRVDEVMHLSNTKKVVDTLAGDPLTKKDMSTCLKSGAWLNDEIINAYLSILVDHLRSKTGNAGRNVIPHYHAFNSFFFSNLRDRGYSSVRRWAARGKIGKADLLQVNTVFIPVHNNAHWTLIVVKPTERTIEHFDSLGSLSKTHVDTIKTWLRGELGELYIDEEWKVEPSLSPQQDNGSDCGVFLLTTAKAVALHIEPQSYTAKDTPLLRRKIVAELMNRGLDGDFAPQAAL